MNTTIHRSTGLYYKVRNDLEQGTPQSFASRNAYSLDPSYSFHPTNYRVPLHGKSRLTRVNRTRQEITKNYVHEWRLPTDVPYKDADGIVFGR